MTEGSEWCRAAMTRAVFGAPRPRAGIVSTAADRNAPRHPRPRTRAAVSASGPTRLPTEPTNVHRAMLCSCRVQVDVHQRRLRQTDECPRRRKEDDPRDQQNGEALAHRHERKRCRERYAAADHQQPSIPHVAENAKKRLDKAGQNAGNAEQQSDLHVRKVEVAPDEGPRRALPMPSTSSSRNSMANNVRRAAAGRRIRRIRGSDA